MILLEKKKCQFIIVSLLKKCHALGIITLENAQDRRGGADDAKKENRKRDYALDREQRQGFADLWCPSGGKDIYYSGVFESGGV